LSALQFLEDRFAAAGDRTALVWENQEFSYQSLLEALDRSRRRLAEEGVRSTDVVSLTADFSPNAVAMLLALAEQRCTIVPLTHSSSPKRAEFLDIAQVSLDITIEPDERVVFARRHGTPSHPLYDQLWHLGHPGLILFSSGSTGRSKAVVHDFLRIAKKYETPRSAKRTIAFLTFDHIGGVNTLLHVLSNGGTVVTVTDRRPASVCRAIEQYAVQVLPTSPTFLNLLLMSGALEQFDLSPLETITYGTEVMHETTLVRLRAAIPGATLLQTYGLSEVGILRSKSASSESLWVRLGGEGIETRIVDGVLQIKSESAMLGYLNAPAPFTEDGWFMTGDVVEERDGYFRIFGRQSEIINVGGEKVFPAEVESVLQNMDGLLDVVVYSEPNAIVGNVVVAKVHLATPETVPQFRKRMIQHCRQYLQPFKVPQKVVLTDEPLHGVRFKRLRCAEVESLGDEASR
jgi:acyl-coenzyme A synthetase/AMP-(fatty) acid ligase